MENLVIGRVQMRIMRVLWDKKRATAHEITNSLNETETIKHSTVQTLLRTLVKRGAVGYDVDNRTFVFYPLVEDMNVERDVIQDIIDRIFEGSAENMVLSIIKNKYISGEELEKIRELFDNEDE